MSSEDTDDIGKRFLEEISHLEQKTNGMTPEEKQQFKSLIKHIREIWAE